MNPFEMILSQLGIGRGTPEDAARGVASDPEMPLLVPGAPQPTRGQTGIHGMKEAAAARGIENTSEPLYQPDGDNSPAMILRRLITGSSQPPNLLSQPPPPPNMDPEGAGGMLAKRPAAPFNPAGVRGGAIEPLPGMVIGARPGPAANQADLLAMFNGGSQQPTASAMPPRPAGGGGAGPTLPPFQTSVQPAPQGQGGIMEMLGGLKSNPTANALVDIINGAMRGAAMNVNNPRGMGIGAFGAGYTGAQEHISKRDKEKAASELASQKLKFDQTLAVRKDSRDERGAGRDDEKLKLSREDQTRKNEETGARVRKLDAEIAKAKAGGLTAQNIINVENFIQREIKEMRASARSEKEIADTERLLRSRLSRQFQSGAVEVPGGQQGAAAPAAVALPKPGGVVKGYVFKGGDLNDRNNWVKQGQ